MHTDWRLTKVNRNINSSVLLHRRPASRDCNRMPSVRHGIRLTAVYNTVQQLLKNGALTQVSHGSSMMDRFVCESSFVRPSYTLLLECCLKSRIQKFVTTTIMYNHTNGSIRMRPQHYSLSLTLPLSFPEIPMSSGTL